MSGALLATLVAFGSTRDCQGMLHRRRSFASGMLAPCNLCLHCVCSVNSRRGGTAGRRHWRGGPALLHQWHATGIVGRHRVRRLILHAVGLPMQARA
jgi:hypothetical protein